MLDTYEELDKLLTEFDWILECYSPLEIRHPETNSFASGYAAEIVIDHLHSENYFLNQR